MWRVSVGRALEQAMPITNEGHGALAEVPENATQRFHPLDSQNHVKGSEHEAIRVDGERAVPDVDAQTLQHDSGSGSYIDVPKIVGGTRIQQGEEAGTVDDDRKLHRASRVRLYAVERVHRDCRITVKLALFVRVSQLLRYLDHEQVLA
jgi:hypothetical protein